MFSKHLQWSRRESAEDEIEEKKGIKCDKDVIKMDIYIARQPFWIRHGLFLSPFLLLFDILRRSWIERELFRCCIIALNFHTQKEIVKFWPKKALISCINNLSLSVDAIVFCFSFILCHNQYNWFQGEAEKKLKEKSSFLPLIFQDISSRFPFVLVVWAPDLASFYAVCETSFKNGWI